MNDNDKELLNQVEEIMDNAAYDISKAKEQEMKAVMATLVQKSQQDNLLPTGDQVLYFMIGEQDIDQVNPDEAARTPTTEGKTIDQLRNEGYTGGRVTMPFTFDNPKDAIENFENVISGILADYSQGSRSWASVTCYKEQGTLTYVMVASRCVTIHKVLPTGDTVTTYHDPDNESTKEDVAKDLYSTGKRLVEAQYTFTCAPQVMRTQFPNTYKATLEQVIKAMKERDNEDNDQ